MLAVVFCCLIQAVVSAQGPVAESDQPGSSRGARANRPAEASNDATERASRPPVSVRRTGPTRSTFQRLSEFLQTSADAVRTAPTESMRRAAGSEPTERTTGQPAGDGTKAPAIEEVKPEVLYLRDKSGRLVPVPGFTYEDFIELIGLKQRLAEPAPAVPDFSLQQLIISGKAGEQTAELTVRIDVRVRKPDWVRVPLGLGETALAGAAEYVGQGEHFLHYDESTKQYVAWLRGSAGGDHHLKIQVHAPLSTAGEQRKMTLALPRAATSQLALKVAGGAVVASATPAGLVPEVTRDDGSSEIRLLGVAGDFVLSWSEQAGARARAESMLETSGTISVKIDGRSVTTDATLSVRSFGEEFDRFRVRLPKGAFLEDGQQNGYTLTSVGGDSSPLAEVRLDKPTLGPFEVKLHTERAFDLARPSESLELAGFQVLEAAPHRQGGHIGVVVSGDWQVIWENRSRVRQIDEAPEALRHRDLLAAFEYVGQPCSLTARVAPRRTRIVVDPEYIYHVDAQQTRLEARLKYSIRGAKVFSVDLDMPGWEIEEIGPSSLVDFESAVTGEDGPLRIPLQQPTAGDIEITLRARRPHASDPSALELQLPALADAAVGPATVAIVPEDNIQLTTKTAQLVALSPQRAPPDLYLPPRRQDALIFRAERSSAKYVADMIVHAQKIAVQVSNAATISRAGVNVEQRFAYQVFYEPVTRLHFAVPRRLAAPNGFEMFVDGEPVSVELVADDQDANDSMRMQLTLSEPRIGLLEVVGRSRLPADELQAATTLPFDIPLAMPLEGEFSGNTLVIDCEAGFRAELRDEDWKRFDKEAPQEGQRLHLAAAAAATSAAVSIVVENRPAMTAAIIERGWLQTWLTDHVRQERAVFQFTASEPRLAVRLPPGVSTEDLEALLDSRPVLPTLRDNVVEIEWPADTDPHVVEFRYRYRERAENGMSVSFQMPEFEEKVRLRRVYWQLILPRDQHLLSTGTNLTPEFTWIRDRLYWSRANLLDQFDLEQWAQTRHEPPLPESLNVYLFSVMGDGQVLDVRVARRSTIVFTASLTALLMMIFALYAPWLRRARSLMAAGAVLIALAFAYPEPAILFAQAALLGVALALLAAVLHRVLRRESTVEEVRPVPSNSMVERTSTDVYYRPAGVSTSSTPTAIAIERSSSESHVQ